MASIIKKDSKNFKIKDISSNEIIQSTNDSFSGLNIITENEKNLQNKSLVKDSNVKVKEHAEKVTDIKKALINDKKDVENDKKDNFVKETSYKETKNKKRSKKMSFSDKLLNKLEYGFDKVIGEDDDVGIDTVLKTKSGIKKTVNVTDKSYKVNRKIADKTFEVATSEEAKKFYAGTIETTKKVYKTAKEIPTQVYIRHKVNSNIKKNSLRQRQKKEIWKKAREKAKEQVGNAVYWVASKIKDFFVSLFTKKVVFIGILIIAMLLFFLSPIVGISTLFAFSVNLALDDNITLISEYISELDYEINARIDNVEEKYSYADRFVYNVDGKAKTDYERVYAYLKAKYGDKKLSSTQIKSEIKQIHNNLYDLSIDEKRKTYVRTSADGTRTTYVVITITVNFDSESFSDFYEDNKDLLLEENQQGNYENILKMIDENVGKTLNNPFLNVDWRKHVSSEFGYRNNPNTDKKEKHTGIDIAMPKGTKIYACMSGEVKIFNDDNLGLYLTITNGQEQTLYAHCNKILVADGNQVNVGDLIAEVGSSGNSTDNHLHLEYIIKGEKQNPRAYLKNYKE